jgi:putative ubiquitin-RnfH superfamily antitoxin RatB of RatAB toxin-antitoxin module
MADARASLSVQVCYPAPGAPILRDLLVAAGSTLHDAIEQSGVLRQFPEIDLAQCRVGIFGKIKPLDTELRDRDRVEIYRPLIADPKESRRQRAEKKAMRKAAG